MTTLLSKHTYPYLRNNNTTTICHAHHVSTTQPQILGCISHVAIVTNKPYQNQAARLLGISADDLLNMDTKETPIDLSTINNTLGNKTFELHIRKKPSTSQNAAPFYYNLNDYKLVPDEGLSSSALLERASTTIAYQGTTIEFPTAAKKHSA